LANFLTLGHKCLHASAQQLLRDSLFVSMARFDGIPAELSAFE
jgi:hypothetical protein